MNRNTIAIILLLFSACLSHAQEKTLPQRYESAVSFLWENLNEKRIFNLWIEPQWFGDSTGLWYVTRSAEGKRYWQVTWEKLEKEPLFDQQLVSKALEEVSGEAYEASNLPLTNISKVGDSLKFSVDDQLYALSLDDHKLIEVRPGKEEASNSFESDSPNSNWTAFTKDYNLFVRDQDGMEKQLSTDGTKGYEYASWYGWADIMEGEGGTRPERFYVNWSPDSEWVGAEICDYRTAQKMYLLDWSVDTLYRPRLLSYYRGSPGDTGMVYMEPVFFHPESGKQVRPDLPKSTHINSIGVLWTDAPGQVLLMHQNRGYQDYTIYQLNLETEELKVLYKETSETNIDNFRYWEEVYKDRLFFLSERTGWRQLYALDLKKGKLTALTSGDFYVQGIIKVDDENERIYFRASGKETDQDPYTYHLYSVDFKGRDLQWLTKDQNHHQVSISPDSRFIVDNVSRVSEPTTSVLRDSNTGKILLTLSQADITGIDNWTAPQTFQVKAEDGQTDIYGALWKPTHFDPNKTYPIIDNSYTGPHTNVFPSTFSQAFSNQALAELGFIVMRVDGRGSAGRSKTFHNFSYKNLGGNLGDHVHAMRQLGERFSWVDTTRVGIYGHSAGGYDAAHALLAFPDFYDVGVASSADHDHRMEKAWWPEMYMGWPVDSAYHLQSNISMASNLKGKLLITHGGIDENVNPSATFKLAEALINADKPFDLLIFPSQRHGYRGNTRYYFMKSRWNYFVRHLLNEEPIWDFEWQ